MDKANEPASEAKWGRLLNEFLWTCAGVNKKILRQCPTDYAKYAGIGGTILFTALMAMLSGGYALYFVFRDKSTNDVMFSDVFFAMLFGMFWGLLIFNLDRFIVNTMYSDGKVTISRREFTSGLPRIIMAIFLGIVISTPLELKIFEDEIAVQVEKNKQKELDKLVAKNDSTLQLREQQLEDLRATPLQTTQEPITGNAQIDALIVKKNSKVGQISAVDVKIKNLVAQRNSLPRTDANLKKIGNLNAAIAKQRVIKGHLNAEINGIQAKINTLSGVISESVSTAQKKRQEDEKRLISQIDSIRAIITNVKIVYGEELDKNYGGFQARMKAFDDMKSENSSTRISAIFIMLLFIIIETTPTFFKMMIASGPYDDMLRSEMHKVRVLSDMKISDINDEIKTEVQINSEKNKSRLETEIAANKELLSQVAAVQAELLSTAISKWREEELAKIEKNPSQYIKTGTATNQSNS